MVMLLSFVNGFSVSRSRPTDQCYTPVATSEEDGAIELAEETFHPSHAMRADQSGPPNISASTVSASPPLLSHQEHFRLSFIICPLWFIANLLYYYSLFLTSVSSSTVIRCGISIRV